MNREDIIKLAREAWLSDYGANLFAGGADVEVAIYELEAFADLVISHKLDEIADKLQQDFKQSFGADTCASWAAWIREQK